jgi:predicted AAA+ superfamily ATPase
VVERDVAEFSGAHHLGRLPRLLRLLAGRTAQELNASHVARDLEIPRSTLDGYLPLLQIVYLVHLLPAYSRNVGARAVRHPKIHFVDSGLCAHLWGIDGAALAAPGAAAAGPLLETFVVGELMRQATWSQTSVELFHFRDHDRSEVDVVLEARDGRIAAVEVKAASAPRTADVRGLDVLRERLGDRFVHGVVLHLGDQVLPFGDRVTALPLTALWSA